MRPKPFSIEVGPCASAARNVGLERMLDLDNLGTQQSQQVPAIRAGQHVRDVQDSDAV
jgi:hypothetical protein